MGARAPRALSDRGVARAIRKLGASSGHRPRYGARAGRWETPHGDPLVGRPSGRRRRRDAGRLVPLAPRPTARELTRAAAASPVPARRASHAGAVQDARAALRLPLTASAVAIG